MDEIQSKYLISHFKERANKQKAVKFEEIDLDIYKPSSKCAAFVTSEERILHWIRTFQFRYYETLKDNNSYYIEWMDHENFDSSNFQEIEIKIYKIDFEHTAELPDLSQHRNDAISDSHRSLLITIHLYLTTGVIMFQGYAFKVWADQEFPILKNLTEIAISNPLLQHDPDTKEQNPHVSHAKDVEIPEDKALLQNLAAAVNTLPSKKGKTKSKKSNPMAANQDTYPEITTAPDPVFTTPLINRKRRNSLDSMRSLSSRKSVTVSELKAVVSNLEVQITEINSVLKSQSLETLVENKISQLMDKITQVEKSSKVQIQSLSSRITDLEDENQTLKSENAKLKSEIQNVKGKLKSFEQSYNEKLHNSIADMMTEHGLGKKDKDNNKGDKRSDQEKEQQLTFPDDVIISNTFAALQETSSNQSTSDSPPSPNVSANDHSQISSDDNNTTPSEENPPEGAINDDVVILIDSNGKYIDTARFIPDKKTRQMFCPTLSSVTKTLTESFLGRPSHLIIHVGTNDIERSSLDSCLTQFETMVEIASQKYPSSKVLISSLLKRRDATDQRRSDLNSKLGTVCAPYPNVHLVNNENIPEDYLHDNKHLKRRKIGALVTNLKDVIFNRLRLPRKSIGSTDKLIPPLMRSPLTTFQNSRGLGPLMTNASRLPHQVNYPSLPPIHQSTAQSVIPQSVPQPQPVTQSVPQPSYAEMARMPPPETTTQAGMKPQSININTVMELLRLYESTRHQ